MTYETWLQQVREALVSINMPMDDWQGIWPFDFSGEHDQGTNPDTAAMKANRFWWYQQNKSMGRGCDKLPGCWLPLDHQGACQPMYDLGDHIKVEFEGENGMPGERMWVIVQRRDDKERMVYGTVDNEPVNEYGGKVRLGSELAISYDKVREHRTATAPSRTNGSHMNAEDMRSLNPGDTLLYDDGRPGHRGVKAVVLSNYANVVVVQFEDRADTTTIKHNDVGWTKHLRRRS